VFVELGRVEDGGWGMNMHGGMRELNANTESMFECLDVTHISWRGWLTPGAGRPYSRIRNPRDHRVRRKPKLD